MYDVLYVIQQFIKTIIDRIMTENVLTKRCKAIIIFSQESYKKIFDNFFLVSILSNNLTYTITILTFFLTIIKLKYFQFI